MNRKRDIDDDAFPELVADYVHLRDVLADEAI